MGKRSSFESLSTQNKFLFVIATILLVWNLTQFGLTLEITGKATSTGDICIDSPPSIVSISNNQTNHTENLFINISASDANQDNITFTTNTSFIDITQINKTRSTLNITTNISLVGAHNILVTATDQDGCASSTDQTTFTLTILNNAPINNATIPNQSWEEDTSLEAFNISKYFIDPDNDTLYFTSNNTSNITVSINDNGTVTFSPDTDFYGNRSITFYANDTQNRTSSNEVNLEVTDTADVCGNLICELSESCSSCSLDCGACPSAGEESGGGRGSSFSNSNEDESQSRRSTENPAGTVPISYEESDQEDSEEETTPPPSSSCTPSWVCTNWEPQECKKDQKQTRSCTDTNNCQGIGPDTSRECQEYKGFIAQLVSDASNSLKQFLNRDSASTGFALSTGEVGTLTIGIIMLALFSIIILALIIIINLKQFEKKVMLHEEFITTATHNSEELGIAHQIHVSIKKDGTLKIKTDFHKIEASKLPLDKEDKTLQRDIKKINL